MIFTKLGEAGAVLLTSDRCFSDARGIFMESYRLSDIRALLGVRIGATEYELAFVQANLSISGAFVLRGLHYQTGCFQGKLIRCVAGAIFHANVDVRKDSPTFGKWAGHHLTAHSGQAVWVPPGFANGFYTMENGATVAYDMTCGFNEKLERALSWRDPAVGITWPVGPGANLQMSAKDRGAPLLADCEPWTPPTFTQE